MFKIRDKETLELLKKEYKFGQHMGYLYLYVKSKEEGENFIYLVDVETLKFTVEFELDKFYKSETWLDRYQEPHELVEESVVEDLVNVNAEFDFDLLFEFITKGIVVRISEFPKNEDNSVEQLTS